MAGPRDAAGLSYAREWALFCDFTTATGQPTLLTTVDALTGFLTALPARPATLARSPPWAPAPRRSWPVTGAAGHIHYVGWTLRLSNCTFCA